MVREWKRGTPLDSANAVKVFEGEATDVAVSGYMVCAQYISACICVQYICTT